MSNIEGGNNLVFWRYPGEDEGIEAKRVARQQQRVEDKALLAAYAETHNGQRPGDDRGEGYMEYLERADSACAAQALGEVGGNPNARYHDFSAPAGRLAVWEEVDYLRANPPVVSTFPALDMAYMRRTA